MSERPRSSKSTSNLGSFVLSIAVGIPVIQRLPVESPSVTGPSVRNEGNGPHLAGELLVRDAGDGRERGKP